MNTQYFYLGVLLALLFLIFTDVGIQEYTALLIQRLNFHYQKYKWNLMNHPANPIVRMIIRIRSERMARELYKELQEHVKNSSES